MNILICIDKFKGSLSSKTINQIVKQELLPINPNTKITAKAIADGGDGSLKIIQDYIQAEWIEVDSFDPLGRNMVGRYLLKDHIAYVELAVCSGLALLDKEDRDPFLTSTYGTGVLIRDALNRGARHINIFLGGSATIDGGSGILHALGVVFYGEHQRVLFPNGGNLEEIVDIDFSKLFEIRSTSFQLITDVENTLLGENGAVHVYGAQKGLLAEDREYMEESMRHFSETIKEYLDKDISTLVGGGSAGGVAAGLNAFLDAKMKSGTDFFMHLLNLEEQCKEADYLITGEGCLDSQTWSGKIVGDLIRLAHDHHTMPLLICGKCDASFYENEKVNSQHVFALSDLVESEEESINRAAQYIPELVQQMKSHIL